MDIPGGSQAITSVTGVASGKRYAEVVLDVASTATPTTDCIGISPLTGGGSANPPRIGGLGLQKNGNIYAYDALVAAGALALVVTDVVNLAVDCATGNAWVGRNGTWYNSGDPAAGTGATTVLTLDTFHVSASHATASTGAKFSLRTQTSQFTGSIPSGFSAWYT